MSQTEKVRIDVLRRFGYYSTESNGHLSEYVAWYRKRPRDIPKWIDRSSWINGETGGYLRVSTEGRNWFLKAYLDMLKESGAPLTPERRGHEHGSYIIEGLQTGRIYRGHFNVVNNGCISNLPDDAIVEAPGYVDRNGINIPRVGPLPLGCAAVCNASISVQRLAVEAAVRGDAALLQQAMLMDPLTGAVCDPEDISQMTDEMLAAQARWLPQYRREIPLARARLTAARREGLYRGTHTSKGAVRIPIGHSARASTEWARREKARIIRQFTVTPLQSAGNIRKAVPPRNPQLYTVSAKARFEGGNGGFVDIRQTHQGKDGILFLRATVGVPKAGAGRLVYGADGPVKLWVNGAAVDCRPEATNPAVAGQYKARVKWRRGANEVIVGLATNHGHAWGIFLAAG